MTSFNKQEPSKKADKWTILGMLGEGIASALCNYSSAASWVLLFSKDQDTAQICGVVMSFAAVASMITRKGLFKQGQHSHSPAVADSHPDVLEYKKLPAEHPHTHSPSHLSLGKKSALAVDYVTHSNDIAGAITQWQDVAGLDKLSFALVIFIHTTANTLGLLGSVAHTRVCKTAMIKEQAEEHAQECSQQEESSAAPQKNHKADKWTILGVIGEGVQSLACNYSHAASWASLFTKEEDTASARYFGAVMALCAVASMLTHHVLFKQGQAGHGHSHGTRPHVHSHSHEIELAEEASPAQSTAHHHQLSSAKKLALGLDFITHSNDVGGAITSWMTYAGKSKLPFWAQLSSQVAATVIGGLSSVANVRTCGAAMVEEQLESAAPTI